MFYPKNVPNWERVSRIALGVVLIVLAFTGTDQPLRMGLLIFSAGFVLITGFVGFCPMCALVGRKIKQNAKSK